jgi:hypothetical protein
LGDLVQQARRQRRLRLVHQVQAVSPEGMLEQSEKQFSMRLLVQGPSPIGGEQVQPEVLDLSCHFTVSADSMPPPAEPQASEDTAVALPYPFNTMNPVDVPQEVWHGQGIRSGRYEIKPQQPLG